MKSKLQEQRSLIVDIVRHSKWPGHLSSAMSIIEIINVLYDDILVIDETGIDGSKSDKVILSKGHGALALYVKFAEKGFIKYDDLYEYNKFNAMLGSHPSSHKVPGVDVSSGSLGHGLPMGLGMAYSYSLDSVENVVYVIVGDGEMNEGSNWEAIISASTNRMKLNICLVIDINGLEEFGSNTILGLKEKIEKFGWTVFECNGHNESEIKECFRRSRKGLNVIIANCIKGKGFKTMELSPEEWHYRSVSDQEYEQLVKELL
ncbi:transketolase [Aliarcobacter butzleri]|uniref:1-deoxy-D-xylulose-5-phosphate synthase N-terminal domain-containing protein n=1 Tax=Aliarcobacter butzleri TaxID=28197 RepID=UPI001EDAC168|nr:1-deoxy-D-xylulose-5-phosphate synthase N-terminal domain-containing protein [Aliarcobacter butzleri]MCG3710620.1 transketolase [Aliarcobacter butzleri]MCG3714119.1 transketolase [Aliarcobacter butzleri]